MKTSILWGLLLAFSAPLSAADIQIQSLAANGRLTFTNTFTNGLFTIQWAPALQSNWCDSWDSLKSFTPSSSVATVTVPMFYRVSCLTNQFIPTVTGRQFTYSVTNTLGVAGTLTATFLGALKLSSGDEYTILELLDDTQCGLRLLPCRSTATEFFDIPFDIGGAEGVEWRNAPPGTTWTNQWCDGSSDQMTVAANEVITVPAGTFNCLKIQEREINNNLRLRYDFWIKPGLMMIKQIDYDYGAATITTNSLASWADRSPH